MLPPRRQLILHSHVGSQIRVSILQYKLGSNGKTQHSTALSENSQQQIVSNFHPLAGLALAYRRKLCVNIFKSQYSHLSNSDMTHQLYKILMMCSSDSPCTDSRIDFRTNSDLSVPNKIPASSLSQSESSRKVLKRLDVE